MIYLIKKDFSDSLFYYTIQMKLMIYYVSNYKRSG